VTNRKWRKAALFGVPFAALIAILALVAAAGVTLTVRNNSKADIEDVAIEYGRGRILVGRLRPGEEKREQVGKIGEGASFKVLFRQGGEQFMTSINVYFADLRLWTTVSFVVMQGQRIRVLHNGEAIAEQSSEVVRDEIRTGEAPAAQPR
jgi:hypothetical protein